MKSDKKYRIYGIFDKKTGEMIYVGQTMQTLLSRWQYHTGWESEFNETLINTFMRHNGGYERYEIELIKLCKTHIDMMEWENHLILECSPTCNKKC